MPRVAWTTSASRDLARLRNFLSDKNPQAAGRAVATIRQGIKTLAAHPDIGRPMGDMTQDYREWPIGFASSAYLVLYQVDNRGIVIHAVRHGRELGY